MTIKVTFSIAQSWAHVPYFEHQDFSVQRPLTVEYSTEQSLAIYAWLEKNELGNSGDTDVFVFRIEGPTNVYLEVLVPVYHGYEEFFLGLLWSALDCLNQMCPYPLTYLQIVAS